MSARIDREAIAGLHQRGLTGRQIAAQLGYSEFAVSRIRKELGVTPSNRMTRERRARIQQMLDDGWSWKEIERTEGASWDTMHRHFPGTAWTYMHLGHMVAATRDVRPQMVGRTSYRRKAA